MFWKVLRWAGTLIVMLIALTALILEIAPAETAAPIEMQTQPKNFNL